MRVRTAICTASLVLLCVAGSGARQDAPIVYTVEVDGIIQPVIAEYLSAALEKADAAGACRKQPSSERTRIVGGASC